LQLAAKEEPAAPVAMKMKTVVAKNSAAQACRAWLYVLQRLAAMHGHMLHCH
jgi:hypothetical protein